MKKIIRLLISSGIWAQPITMVILVYVMKENYPMLMRSEDGKMICFFLSLLPVLFIWVENYRTPNEAKGLMGKEKASHPRLASKLLFKQPTGIVFGKDMRTKKYVCKKLTEDGHVFLLGGSGSGKSSCCVIPSLLANKDSDFGVLAVDVKGELSYKTADYSDEKCVVFNPADRYAYGYNPLYNLCKESSGQDILETMQNITYSLIPMPADIKDPFWKVSARNLLLGLLIYYYREKQTDFIGIIDEILGRPVKESIQEVMANAKRRSPEYRYIIQFADMEDETLSGIVAEMNNHLVIFSNDQDIRYAFCDNFRKCNPRMLSTEGYSIYLTIKEEKLSAYYDVLQLIINQTLAELEKRPENSRRVMVVIDELPRILSAGKIDRLLDAARTLRSRKVTLFLISQSTEALMSAFTENEVADLLSNCPYIIVLSASSTKTQKSVCSWAGKYRVRKQSWNGSGTGTKISVSYEEKDLVDPAELMTLQQTGEAILISPYGYSRIKKTPWYEDKVLCPVAEKIIALNEKESAKETKEE